MDPFQSSFTTTIFVPQIFVYRGLYDKQHPCVTGGFILQSNWQTIFLRETFMRN